MNLPAFYGENSNVKKSSHTNDQFLAPADHYNNTTQSQNQNQKVMGYNQGSSYPGYNSNASNQGNVQQANNNTNMNMNYQYQQQPPNNYNNYQQYNQQNAQGQPQQRYSYYVQTKNWCSRDKNWLKACLMCTGVTVGCTAWICCCCCCKPSHNGGTYSGSY